MVTSLAHRDMGRYTYLLLLLCLLAAPALISSADHHSHLPGSFSPRLLAAAARGHLPTGASLALRLAYNGRVRPARRFLQDITAPSGTIVATEVVARKQEDSGNSGVADEMVLPGGAKSAKKEEEEAAEAVAEVMKEAEAAAEPDEPVVELTTQQQLEIEVKALEDEEGYASFMDKMLGIHNRMAPTWEGVKDKTAKHVIPTLSQLAQSSRKAFVKTSETLHRHIQPLVGDTISALVSSLLSYTLLLIPVVAILLLLNRVRVILTVRKAILISNLYLTMYCAVLVIACAVVGGEPMTLLSIASISSFMLLQIVQAGAYLVYLALLAVGVFVAFKCTFSQYQPVPSGPGTPARWKYADIVEASVQLGIAVGIGVHYYIKVFELAMLDKLPQISIVAYAVYCVLFIVQTWLSRGAAKSDQKSK